MHGCFRLASLLLSCATAGLLGTLNAGAQSCRAQYEQDTNHHQSATVSVSELRIPRRAWEHFENARIATLENRLDAFEREADLALAIAPDFAAVYLLRAANQVAAHQFDAAILTIEVARKIHPAVLWADVVLAGAFTGLHRYDEAAAALDRAEGAERESWQWKFERTRAELGRQNVEAALHWSELTVDAMPARCAEARLLRANAFQMAGRPADAITQLEAYLSSEGGSTYRHQVLQILERTRAAVRQENAGPLAAR